MRDIVHRAMGDDSTSGEGLSRIIQNIQRLYLTSQAAGLRHLYRGLSASLPVELMPLFSASELEGLFCGEDCVDLDTLRQATVYDGDVKESDSHIQFFWASLEELSPEDRAHFVNFCSGRSRLPPSAADYPLPFKLVGPPTHSEKNPDNYLPIARTCFFTLSLPKYTSKEVRRDILLIL